MSSIPPEAESPFLHVSSSDASIVAAKKASILEPAKARAKSLEVLCDLDPFKVDIEELKTMLYLYSFYCRN